MRELTQLNTRQKVIDFGIASLVLGLYVRHCFPLLFVDIPSGWDTASHRYLYETFLSCVNDGRLSCYDLKWFGGYPAFTFYGPFLYLVLGVPYFLSFGQIDKGTSFNLVLFLLPLLFLGSFYLASRRIFGPQFGKWALCCSLIFFSIPVNASGFGVGLVSLTYMGLLANFLGLVQLILFVLALEKVRELSNLWNLICLSLLLALIVITHSLTAIFSGTVLLVFTILHFRKLCLKLIFSVLLALLFTFWWWVPFVKNLWLSSSQEGAHGDPLEILLFNFNSLSLRTAWIDPLPMFRLPIASLCLFIFAIVGLVQSFRKREYVIGTSFLITLVFLPRTFLSHLFTLGLHYQRFTAGVFVLYLFLAVYGMGTVWEFTQREKAHFRRRTYSGLFSLACLWSFFNCAYAFETIEGEQYATALDDYVWAKEAKMFSDELARFQIQGRIAVEEYPDLTRVLGSAHYFQSTLPLRYGLPVMPGLLTESSVSAGFQTEAISAYSKGQVWGRNVMFIRGREEKFGGKAAAIARLSLFHVQFILTTSDEYRTFLADECKDTVNERLRSKHFGLFELKAFRPLVEETEYKPFLYIERGGIGFRRFSERWFENAELFDYPVLYTERGFSALADSERRGIGGLIISYPFSSFVPKEEYEAFVALHLPLIFLGAVESRDTPSTEAIHFISRFSGDTLGAGPVELHDVLRKFAFSIARNKIAPETSTNDEIRIDAQGGVLINYSYFPRWRSETPSQTIFMATPSLMFVFAHGPTTLIWGQSPFS